MKTEKLENAEMVNDKILFKQKMREGTNITVHIKQTPNIGEEFRGEKLVTTRLAMDILEEGQNPAVLHMLQDVILVLRLVVYLVVPEVLFHMYHLVWYYLKQFHYS
ncbi:hypothetical protein RhiirA4_469182 [Rhizophagus irregularis]|uniref:Uncharacterized protein n=1 Tax=Rhizophagus irregularis TaxID=588596 RepID=A0A2I1GZ29_9GLOM|nr:hypothetical protein RhiirA4_469182 [Rhizophagus irregularis]